jgi:hypothetical protein
MHIQRAQLTDTPWNGGPGNKRDRQRYARLTPGRQTAASRLAGQLYDGSRTVARCWTEALTAIEAKVVWAMFDKLTVRQAQTLSRLLGKAYDNSMRASRQMHAARQAAFTYVDCNETYSRLAGQAAMRQELTQLRWMLADRISHA